MSDVNLATAAEVHLAQRLSAKATTEDVARHNASSRLPIQHLKYTIRTYRWEKSYSKVNYNGDAGRVGSTSG